MAKKLLTVRWNLNNDVTVTLTTIGAAVLTDYLSTIIPRAFKQGGDRWTTQAYGLLEFLRSNQAVKHQIDDLINLWVNIVPVTKFDQDIEDDPYPVANVPCYIIIEKETCTALAKSVSDFLDGRPDYSPQGGPFVSTTFVGRSVSVRNTYCQALVLNLDYGMER